MNKIQIIWWYRLTFLSFSFITGDFYLDFSGYCKWSNKNKTVHSYYVIFGHCDKSLAFYCQFKTCDLTQEESVLPKIVKWQSIYIQSNYLFISWVQKCPEDLKLPNYHEDWNTAHVLYAYYIFSKQFKIFLNYLQEFWN